MNEYYVIQGNEMNGNTNQINIISPKHSKNKQKTHSREKHNEFTQR